MSDEPETISWDTEVTLTVTVQVTAKPNPEYFDGVLGRTAQGCAESAIWTGIENLERLDGYADLIGEARIVDIQAD